MFTSSVTYSATAHRFWRFRHNGAAQAMSFEVSADGQTRTAIWTVQSSFAVDSLKVVLKGHNTGATKPSTAVYNNLRMEATR